MPEISPSADSPSTEAHTLDFRVQDEQGHIPGFIESNLFRILRDLSRNAGLPLPDRHDISVKTSEPVAENDVHSRIRGVTVITTLAHEYRELIVQHMSGSGYDVVDRKSILRIAPQAGPNTEEVSEAI